MKICNIRDCRIVLLLSQSPKVRDRPKRLKRGMVSNSVNFKKVTNADRLIKLLIGPTRENKIR